VIHVLKVEQASRRTETRPGRFRRPEQGEVQAFFALPFTLVEPILSASCQRLKFGR